MKPPSHITQLLLSLAQFKSEVALEEGAHRLKFEHDSKLVKVLWPNGVDEVFLDFTKGGEMLLAESVEYYECENGAERGQDIARIIENFLLNEVKVVKLGRSLGRNELQYFRSGRWLSVFKSAMQ